MRQKPSIVVKIGQKQAQELVGWLYLKKGHRQAYGVEKKFIHNFCQETPWDEIIKKSWMHPRES
jgi:hypothetical protein